MSYLPFVATRESVNVIFADGPSSIRSSHPNFESVLERLKAQSVLPIDEASLRLDMQPITVVKAAFANSAAAAGVASVEGSTVLYGGSVVHGYMAERILDLLSEGFDIAPWLRFMEKLYQNPSFTARNELFMFLEKADLPLTEDGDFLAYKRVGVSYMDLYSGTFNNSPGSTVSMPREDVDDDRRNLCSQGLHVCSWEYLPHYHAGALVVMVKVNPANVVAVPADYNDAKMRVWSYEVIADVTDAASSGPLKFDAVVNGDGPSWSDRWNNAFVDDDEESDFDPEYDDYDDDYNCDDQAADAYWQAYHSSIAGGFDDEFSRMLGVAARDAVEADCS
jgi:hypothetical protein